MQKNGWTKDGPQPIQAQALVEFDAFGWGWAVVLLPLEGQKPEGVAFN